MKNLFSVLIILAFLSAGYLLWQNYSTPPVSEEDESPDMGMLVEGSGATDLEVTEEASVSANAPTTASVSYDGSSFSPSPVTVKRGGTVTWSADDEGKMWVASAKHPSHTVYSDTTLQQHCPDATGVAFDQCTSGTSYSFTFDKIGTWNYHDHINSSAFGAVIVVE